MDRQHIRAFLAVAEELHFGRAAIRLHMAQPPLSRMIRQLERHLGAELFERTTRTVRLTAEGRAMLEPARAIEANFAMVERAVTYAGSGEVGQVEIGFAGPSSHNLISSLAQLVRQEQPGIELVLSSTTYGREALDRVLDGKLSLAIVCWDHPLPGISSRIVRVDHYVVVVPHGHRLADRESVSMSDLKDEHWILLDPRTGSILRDTTLHKAEEAGFSPHIAQEALDTWSITALVAAGVGITLSLDTAFPSAIEGIETIPLDYGRDIAYAHLVWRRDNNDPALRRVIELSQIALPTPAEAAESADPLQVTDDLRAPVGTPR